MAVLGNHKLIKRTKKESTVMPKITAAQKKKLTKEISDKAYELYENRGRIDGFNEQDWFEAQKFVYAKYGIEK